MSTEIPNHVVEIERRMRWRFVPLVLFALMLVSLSTTAAISLLVAPSRPTGLPDDPDVVAAESLVAGRVGVAVNDLRFHSSLLGGDAPNRVPHASERERLAAARARLAVASERHPREPRIVAALATLDLATHDYARAERGFRASFAGTPHYGEGRLGAGVALALAADVTPDHWTARGLRLEAIANLAMVGAADPAYPAALYDRALLLVRVGRVREAERYAQRYLQLDSSSPWATRLKAELAGAA